MKRYMMLAIVLTGVLGFPIGTSLADWTFSDPHDDIHVLATWRRAVARKNPLPSGKDKGSAYWCDLDNNCGKSDPGGNTWLQVQIKCKSVSNNSSDWYIGPWKTGDDFSDRYCPENRPIIIRARTRVASELYTLFAYL